jgi:DNA-binding response OmpR family regulator
MTEVFTFAEGRRNLPMRILVIEDETRMLELLRKGLEERDCAVTTAQDGVSGLEIATACEFDAVILDIGLPDRNGFELVRILRQRGRQTPVMMLTARDGEDEIIRGLDLGADDYMTKPFSFLELMARITSITRPLRVDGICRMEFGDLAIDPLRRQVTRERRTIDLSRSEFNLLVALGRNAGQCVPRIALMKSVWGTEMEVGTGALDVLVNSLRGKLDAPFQRKMIGTVRGSGYMLDPSATIQDASRS